MLKEPEPIDLARGTQEDLATSPFALLQYLLEEGEALPPPELNLETGYNMIEFFRRIHNLVYPPTDYFPPDAPEDNHSSIAPFKPKGLETFKRRMEQSKEFRRLVLLEFSKEFPTLTDHYQALEIMDAIAEPINQVFEAQMEHVEHDTPRSWYDDAPEAVERLYEIFYQLRQIYRGFFDRHPENEEILTIVCEQLAYARESEEFPPIAAQLEKLLLQAAKKGSPVIAVLPSDFYSRPNSNSNKLFLADAGLRLLFPYTGKDAEKFNALAKEQSAQTKKIFHALAYIMRARGLSPDFIMKNAKGITIANGLAIPAFSIGEQLYSLTSGEALIYEPGYYYSFGFVKSAHLVKFSFQLAGIKGDMKKYLQSLIPSYMAHEGAHPFNKLPAINGALSLESTADLPMLIGMLVMYLRNQEEKPELVLDIPYEEMIAGFIGELASIVTQEISGNNYFDSYIVSARNLLYLLIKHGIITVSNTEDSYTITPISKDIRPQFRDLIKEMFEQLVPIFHDDPDVDQNLLLVDTKYSEYSKQYKRLTKWFVDFTNAIP